MLEKVKTNLIRSKDINSQFLSFQSNMDDNTEKKHFKKCYKIYSYIEENSKAKFRRDNYKK